MVCGSGGGGKRVVTWWSVQNMVRRATFFFYLWGDLLFTFLASAKITEFCIYFFSKWVNSWPCSWISASGSSHSTLRNTHGALISITPLDEGTYLSQPSHIFSFIITWRWWWWWWWWCRESTATFLTSACLFVDREMDWTNGLTHPHQQHCLSRSFNGIFVFTLFLFSSCRCRSKSQVPISLPTPANIPHGFFFYLSLPIWDKTTVSSQFNPCCQSVLTRNEENGSTYS